MKHRNMWASIMIMCGLIILAGILFTIWFSIRSEKHEAHESITAESKEVEKLIIPCTEGSLEITDSNGVVLFEYEGDIVIENDGSNGYPIDIHVTIPSLEVENDLQE